MPQQVLGWLVRFRIRDEMAMRNGITVTPADEPAGPGARSRRRPGRAASRWPIWRWPTGCRRPAAGAGPVPGDPDGARQQARRRQAAHLTERAEALSQKFATVQCRAAKSLAIKVNPQFGRMDYNQLAVVPAETKLSAPTTGQPTPSPKPQLTPPC